MKSVGKRFVLTVIFMASVPLFAKDAAVTYVKGKVEVNRGGAWVALKEGDTVSESETVSTGFQSEAKLKYNDSVMYLGALTRITLQELSSQQSDGGRKDNVNVYLNTGIVRSKVSHTSENKVSYTVRSPVAVASVRGTITTSRSDGYVDCTDGAVAVYPANRPSKQASDESEGSGAEGTPEESQASATTPAGSISEYAPAGTVVISKGTSITISDDRPAANPVTTVAKTASDVATQVSSAATKSAGEKGLPPDILPGPGHNADDGASAEKNGNLTVTLTF